MTKKISNIISLNSVITAQTLLQMNRELKNLKEKHKKTCEMAARTILQALDLKDHYTFGHSIRVAYLSVAVGKKLNLSEKELYDLELTALFHDIGKIGTPDGILNKPHSLSTQEFDTMKRHPDQSYEILSQFEDFEEIAIYARHHHEKYDGKGYPDQLKGDEIPLFSRIVLIADTFDAMTSSRPYRKKFSHEVSLDEIKQFSGSQFDPHLVEVFTEVVEEMSQEQTRTFNLSILDGQFLKDAA